MASPARLPRFGLPFSDPSHAYPRYYFLGLLNLLFFLQCLSRTVKNVAIALAHIAMEAEIMLTTAHFDLPIYSLSFQYSFVSYHLLRYFIHIRDDHVPRDPDLLLRAAAPLRNARIDPFQVIRSVRENVA